MTEDRAHKKPSLEQIDEDLAQILMEGNADEAWLEFKITGEPVLLAMYLKLGGEIDDEVRQEIIKLLISHSKRKNSPRNPYRDWVAFTEIEILRRNDKYTQAGIKHGFFSPPLTPTPKELSFRQACQLYADRTRQELRRVEKQYERGKEVAAQNQKKSTKK